MTRSCTASLNANAPVSPAGVSIAVQSPRRKRSDANGSACAVNGAHVAHEMSEARTACRTEGTAGITLVHTPAAAQICAGEHPPEFFERGFGASRRRVDRL